MAIRKDISGNENVSSDFLRVLLALKDNILRDLKVAGIFKVTSIENKDNISSYTCKSINNENISIQAYSLYGLNIDVNDYVLTLFCDDDFRMNYKKLQSGQQLQNISQTLLHTFSYGIIIGIIKKEHIEEVNNASE